MSTSCDKTQDVTPASTNSSVSGPLSNGDDGSSSLQMLHNWTVYYRARPYDVTLQLFQSKRTTIDDTRAMLNAHSFIDEHTIYFILDADIPGTVRPFAAVIDFLPGMTFSEGSLWEMVYITFEHGVAPHQLMTSEEIRKMLGAANPPISARRTGMFYEMRFSSLADQPASTR